MLFPAATAVCVWAVSAEAAGAVSLAGWLTAAVTGDIDDSAGLATSDTLSDSGAVFRTGAGGGVTTLTGATAAVEVTVCRGRGGVTGGFVAGFVVGCELGRVGVIEVIGRPPPSPVWPPEWVVVDMTGGVAPCPGGFDGGGGVECFGGGQLWLTAFLLELYP
jgi:hypothetical protein